MAAGATICLGMDTSKFAAFTASSLSSMAPKNNLEVDLGIPQSTKQKFSGWDKEYIKSLSSLKQLESSKAETGLAKVSLFRTNSMPTVEAKTLLFVAQNGGHTPDKQYTLEPAEMFFYHQLHGAVDICILLFVF